MGKWYPNTFFGLYSEYRNVQLCRKALYVSWWLIKYYLSANVVTKWTENKNFLRGIKNKKNRSQNFKICNLKNESLVSNAGLFRSLVGEWCGENVGIYLDTIQKLLQQKSFFKASMAPKFLYSHQSSWSQWWLLVHRRRWRPFVNKKKQSLASVLMPIRKKIIDFCFKKETIFLRTQYN